MAPVQYSDLGKGSRDLFSKGYNFGQIKLECKTKAANGVEFNTTGSSCNESGKVAGNLETKYKWSEYGLTFTEKWDTNNVLATMITIEDQIAKGLKLTFDSSFSPQTGKKSGQIKTAYKHDYVHVNADVDLDFAGPQLHGCATVGHNGWLAGYQASFDTAKSTLTRNNFAIGYATDDFVLHTNVNDGQEFCGAIYQKVNDDLETAVQLSWTAGSNATRFGLAGKYTFDNDASVSAKVNNSSQLGVGYSQQIRKGVKVTLSALIESKNLNAGGHKFGIGFDLSP
ncbi:PREDICTED: voltage-dependent anion-selective channel protein 2-like [Priapulus caudatus]|uniref:Voltage-dependent anion-selective channel protein 2-like n=1 Tax=Priapulus caudatus TaxID=37621 RepID=A0ABM1EYP1_PRICU|nr:PREDICTED: voltage-dependent anion-selective channel protein 2-like [Priapulus caudatus]XP_014677312.1 PREDICTED: voltage-dependent anion-selective channel protein 2-like [Priapulus caudatus]